jgi:hypothetical protein
MSYSQFIYVPWIGKYWKCNRILTVTIINAHISPCKTSFCFFDFSQNLIFSTDSRKILQYQLTKIRPLAVELFHADSHTDGQTWTNSRFSQFFETSEKITLVCWKCNLIVNSFYHEDVLDFFIYWFNPFQTPALKNVMRVQVLKLGLC